MRASRRTLERAIDEFCDFALCVGMFRGRDHDIHAVVDSAWMALRHRAGILYGKYGQRVEATLRRGFVDLGGQPMPHRRRR